MAKGTYLSQQCDLITGGRLSCATYARSTRRSEVKFEGNYEEADTRGLVVMENSHQSNNVYVPCTAHLSS